MIIGVLCSGIAYLLPVVDRLNVFVLRRFEAWWHVTLTKLFTLVDVKCARQSCLHEAQELRAKLAVLVLVAAVA